jgi:hypothetical protein
MGPFVFDLYFFVPSSFSVRRPQRNLRDYRICAAFNAAVPRISRFVRRVWLEK